MLATYHNVPLKFHGLGHSLGERTDRNLILLSHRKDKRVRGLKERTRKE
jgi:hypothetical protein